MLPRLLGSLLLSAVLTAQEPIGFGLVRIETPTSTELSVDAATVAYWGVPPIPSWAWPPAASRKCPDSGYQAKDTTYYYTCVLKGGTLHWARIKLDVAQ